MTTDHSLSWHLGYLVVTTFHQKSFSRQTQNTKLFEGAEVIVGETDDGDEGDQQIKGNHFRMV